MAAGAPPRPPRGAARRGPALAAGLLAAAAARSAGLWPGCFSAPPALPPATTAGAVTLPGQPGRRGVLAGALAVLWPGIAAADYEETGDEASLYSELPGTSSGEECSCCERDWCCKGDCVDCHAYLKAKGYSIPLDGPSALAAAGKTDWPSLLKWESAKMPGWKPVRMDGLDVRNSSLPGAGLGLFAAAGLPAGAVLPPYRGEALSFGEGVARLGKAYLWCPAFSASVMTAPNAAKELDSAEASGCVDAELAQESNPTRFVNGAVKEEQCGEVNVEMCELGQVLYFRTMKPVPAGMELVTDYGSDYWQDFKSCAA